MRIDAVQPYNSVIGYRPAQRLLLGGSGVVQEALQVAASAASAPQSNTAVANTAPAARNEAFASLLPEMMPTGREITPSANSLSSLSDLYGFGNQYLYSAAGNTYARIDTDADGLWSYNELTAYADAYERATGRALDVDDLMARYSDTGDNSGQIRYQGQQQMYRDDALGISHARDQLILADNNLSTGSQRTRINWQALDSFVDKYTYGTAGKLYARIDQNDDGVWTLDELRGYADAYEKATGVRLDADALFAKYDTDGSGTIKYSEQNAMYRDDALGLSRISQAMSADRESGRLPNRIDNDDLAGRIREAVNGLPVSTKQKLWSTFNEGMQKSAMLDAFMMTNSLIGGRYGWGGYGWGNSYTLWTAGNFALMGMFV